MLVYYFRIKIILPAIRGITLFASIAMECHFAIYVIISNRTITSPFNNSSCYFVFWSHLYAIINTSFFVLNPNRDNDFSVIIVTYIIYVSRRTICAIMRGCNCIMICLINTIICRCIVYTKHRNKSK